MFWKSLSRKSLLESLPKINLLAKSSNRNLLKISLIQRSLLKKFFKKKFSGEVFQKEVFWRSLSKRGLLEKSFEKKFSEKESYGAVFQQKIFGRSTQILKDLSEYLLSDLLSSRFSLFHISVLPDLHFSTFTLFQIYVLFQMYVFQDLHLSRFTKIYAFKIKSPGTTKQRILIRGRNLLMQRN